MFKSLTDSLSSVFNHLKGKSFISEDDFNLAMREIRIALIEADVALEVAKKFINDIKDEVIGKEIIKKVSSAQMIAKIVQDNLVKVLGSEKSDLNLSVKSPVIIMMVGLQGAGKTTTSAKLALKLKKQKKKVLLASLDVYRPAAQKQLEVLGKQIDVKTLPIVENKQPIEIAKIAVEEAKAYDVLILDTAGRLHIDDGMMNELIDIKKLVLPTEIILVGDSMMGQDTINITKAFNEAISLTGIILTRVDGDARGGAALSMRMITNCPIKFIANGEKLTDIEDFYPDRIAKRILNMGDVVSLVEKAAEIVGQEEIDKLQKKVRKGKFDLNDLVNQLKTLNRMGGIANIMKFIPSSFTKKLNNGVPDDSKVKKYIAIIGSMTEKERQDPNILNGKRRIRIAKGSGTNVSDVNLLIKQYSQMSSVVSTLSKSKNKELELMDIFNKKS